MVRERDILLSLFFSLRIFLFIQRTSNYSFKILNLTRELIINPFDIFIHEKIGELKLFSLFLFSIILARELGIKVLVFF